MLTHFAPINVSKLKIFSEVAMSALFKTVFFIIFIINFFLFFTRLYAFEPIHFSPIRKKKGFARKKATDKNVNVEYFDLLEELKNAQKEFQKQKDDVESYKIIKMSDERKCVMLEDKNAHLNAIIEHAIQSKNNEGQNHEREEEAISIQMFKNVLTSVEIHLYFLFKLSDRIHAYKPEKKNGAAANDSKDSTETSENTVQSILPQNILKTPNKPDKPNILTEPNKPNILNEPDKPNILNEPDKPNISNKPDKPNILNEPDESNILNEPDKPNISNKPNKPDILNEPDESNISDISNKLDKQDILDKPEKPNISDISSTSNKLDKLNVSNKPDKSNKPNKPDKSNKPNKSKKS
ncbi:hypothetical protein DLEV_144 [Diachasmimorpha longicaudata entomopoxvirus]|uniref:Uncharacterized protein n=1 Tax=Diachasmimorpha longicaudata entomopoxvirus TaxID=109981 RepID=A0A7R5WFE4_9POXV|nr:hypothetical protein QKK69_gp144 [Diachasmimorpha longicaudata entomopoxvirus]AKS26435.1 hypothetical protein DLEV_144 [Diachasmimorpha longicaudata entomopoxvirus]